MLRCWTSSCTSTHTSCYAAGRCLALPHIRHATLLDVVLHFHAYVILCANTFLAWQAMSSTNSDNFVFETQKKELFHEALRTQNYSFVVVNTRFSNWGDLSGEFKSWIYWRKINMCKLLQFRTCPPSSCDCLVSSPTRPLTGNDTM